jgi:prepilin-type N-terminal cleavage/methylation domain-containing protein
MNAKQSKTCLPISRRGGLTLIEVIIAIAILGMILVGIVLAKSRHMRQFGVAKRKQAAVRATDELITRWWSRPAGVPMDASGGVKGPPALKWRTKLIEKPGLEPLGGRVVRVIVRRASVKRNASDPVEPLVTVDLVVTDAAYNQKPGGSGKATSATGDPRDDSAAAAGRDDNVLRPGRRLTGPEGEGEGVLTPNELNEGGEPR